MSAAKTAEEREQIRNEHHERMKERTVERGLTLPEGSPARGRGMGPGGEGIGPGGGGMGSQWHGFRWASWTLTSPNMVLRERPRKALACFPGRLKTIVTDIWYLSYR
jgi:hypothetical protein